MLTIKLAPVIRVTTGMLIGFGMGFALMLAVANQ